METFIGILVVIGSLGFAFGCFYVAGRCLNRMIKHYIEESKKK
ncbi:unnamed protein product [marine sediment metagenome]|uniref:Uncharacterized protein n=1 Tax=marine sediment metagenome TaxID=412755 RepID=X1S7F7_9ZZZZ